MRDYALVLREEAARTLDWTDPPQRADRYLSIVLIGGANEPMLEWLDDPDPPAIDDLVAELAPLA